MIRNLKDYKWEYKDKKILATGKKQSQSVHLSKIGFTSLARFTISCLDKMRTEEVAKFSEKRAKDRERLNAAKEQIKALKDQIKTLKIEMKELKKDIKIRKAIDKMEEVKKPKMLN